MNGAKVRRFSLATLFASMALVALSVSPRVSADDQVTSLPAYDVERVEQGGALKVGDSVVLRVVGLNAPDVASPAPTETLVEQGWEVMPLPGSAAGEYRFKALALKPGKLTLPSVELKDAAGKSVARTNPLAFEVQSAIRADDPKPQEPEALQPPVSLKFPWWVIAMGVVVAIAVIAAGIYFFMRWWKSRKKAEPARPAEPPKPEDEVALAALSELERDGALAKGNFKVHYFRLSEILKTYIGARYRFDAPESTTREMLRELEDRHLLSDAQLDQLESQFSQLDLVKFTDHVPTLGEGKQLLEGAREFVRATRKTPQILTQPLSPGERK